jgi:pyruvate ferredoxin oxidoreductase gamma subunit
MLALAAIEEGKYAQGFPSFGPERRGAPVMAFNRIGDKPLKVRAGIYKPDVVVILDPSLLKLEPVTNGLKSDGILIVNTTKPAEEIRKILNYKGTLYTVDAAHIAKEELGVNITNTTMLGAVLQATGVLKFESLEPPIEHRFGKLAGKNMAALKRAARELKLAEMAKAA